MADLLFQLRNSFWVGNFEEAISEAKSVAHPNLKIECDFYCMRSELELKTTNINKLDKSLPSALQAVQLLAGHRNGSMSEEMVKTTLDSWMEDENTAENALVQIIAATLYNRLGDWNKALTVLRSEATLEHLALQAQMLVQMHRSDKATQVLSKMQQMDDDSTLTELVKGWICCGSGQQNKKEEGLYAFEELGAKFGRTVLILNNIAACHIALGNYSEADRCLEEAFENTPSAETYINAIVSAQLQNKEKDAVIMYIDNLTKLDINHPWLLERKKKENEFDAAAQNFA